MGVKFGKGILHYCTIAKLANGKRCLEFCIVEKHPEDLLYTVIVGIHHNACTDQIHFECIISLFVIARMRDQTRSTTCEWGKRSA